MEFTDLILLVGTNPLPNAVVASYFIKNNAKLKKIWLVHSGENGTKKYAETLKEFIKNKSEKIKTDDRIVINNTAQKKSIKNAFDNLYSNISKGQTVHLNYTGGTKSMVVHAYRFVEGKKEFNPTFSYLDSNEFKLFFDIEKQTDDLRNEVNISFEEMYKLHGFEGETNELIFEKANKIFENLIEENKLDDFFYKENNGGYTRELFENKKGGLAEKYSEIKEKETKNPFNLDNFEINETFERVVNTMVVEENGEKKDYRLFKERKFNKEIKDKEFKKAVKYLDGKWLEQVIYKRLIELLNLDKYKIEISSNIRRPEVMNFEIDLVVIRGYQLIGISCTTSHDKSLCKSKGFEVIHRAKQIGGDEAKMVLITMLDDEKAKRLKQTLEDNTTGNKNKIIVLGKGDLKKEEFNKKIKFILEDQL